MSLLEATAQYNLGSMYAEGQGVAQDFVQARELLTQAAQSDHPVAAQARDELTLLAKAEAEQQAATTATQQQASQAAEAALRAAVEAAELQACAPRRATRSPHLSSQTFTACLSRWSSSKSCPSSSPASAALLVPSSVRFLIFPSL